MNRLERESNRLARGNGRVKWNSCEEFYSMSFRKPLELYVSRERASANLDFTRLDSRTSRYSPRLQAMAGKHAWGKFSNRGPTWCSSFTSVKENNPNLSRSIIGRVISPLMNLHSFEILLFNTFWYVLFNFSFFFFFNFLILVISFDLRA